MGNINYLMATLTAGAVTEDGDDLYVLSRTDNAIYKGPFTILDDGSGSVELRNAVEVTYNPERSRCVVPSKTFNPEESTSTPIEYFLNEVDLIKGMNEYMAPEEIGAIMNLLLEDSRDKFHGSIYAL